jgi:ammonia channel protein AmtB
MVGKKCHQHNATKLHGYDHCNDTMGRNWFGLSFGPSIGGIIGNPLPNLFFQSVGPNTAWSLAPTIPFLLFALFQAKFAIITPALITGALLNEFVLGLYAIHGLFYFTDLCTFMSYDLASRRIIFQDGSAGFCRRYSSTHECWLWH